MRSSFVVVAALGLLVTLGPLAQRGLRAQPTALPLVQVAPAHSSVGAPPPPSFTGLNLIHIGLDDDSATATMAGPQTAVLTLDPVLQRTALELMSSDHLPEAAVVLIDPVTGQLLVYASHVERGEPRDLCAEATAPAASVFKIVTAAALVDDAGLGPDTRQCYAGGEQRILPSDLVDDPARDRWCVTLGGALGRSVNTVFARLAQRRLTPDQLIDKAHAFGFGEPLSFDVAVQASALNVPSDPLGFARTAAGFWNTTLSPVHAAWISVAIARGGDALRPKIVQAVVTPTGVVAVPGAVEPPHQVIAHETAQALATMMERTVAEGTSYRAFHDAKGTPFLPGITVAGKTGTLTDDHTHRFYTWFTGFAPTQPVAGVRQVAVAVLVANDPTWKIKANVVAREMLRAYFAQQKVQGVSRPLVASRDP